MYKLGLFGDSFGCGFQETDPPYLVSWPDLIAKHLNLKLYNYSYPGTSIWYSYKLFLETYKKFSTIVFIYSEVSRWHSLPDDLKRFSSIYSNEKLKMFPKKSIDGNSYNIMEKLVDIHKYVFDDQLNNFVAQQVFDNVNRICKENNITLINVFPFVSNNDAYISFDNRTGSCLLNINEVSQHETYIKDMIDPIKNPAIVRNQHINFIIEGPDYRQNHINPNNNVTFADIIKERINTLDVYDVFTDSRMTYDENILIEYINYIKKIKNVK